MCEEKIENTLDTLCQYIYMKKTSAYKLVKGYC